MAPQNWQLSSTASESATIRALRAAKNQSRRSWARLAHHFWFDTGPKLFKPGNLGFTGAVEVGQAGIGGGT